MVLVCKRQLDGCLSLRPRHHYRVSFEDPQFADALWNAGLAVLVHAAVVMQRGVR